MSDSDNTADKKEEIEKILAKAKPKPWRKFLVILILALGAVAGWRWYSQAATAQERPQWETATVDKGDMIVTAAATGNLKPRSQVDIGAEVSGRIATVEVDFNDEVKKGQILAKFDTELLEQSLEQARRAMAVELASAKRAQATLEEAKANESRVNTLFGRGGASQAELDSARAQLKRAQADVESTRAQQRVSQLKVSQAQTNLDRAIIYSPIDGVVLQRNVEPGNTVAASLQSPNLFILARDLSEMELHVAIDEADVGMVKADQPASFTVDAYPDRTFEAKVSRVHLFPTTTNNVVTYTAVLEVDNKEGVLRPGMTAMATITTQTRQDVMRVPNSALRFSPRQGASASGGMMSFLRPPGGRRPSGGSGSSGKAAASGGGAVVWTLEAQPTKGQGDKAQAEVSQPKRIALKVGRTDGLYTEVLSDEIKVGDVVLVGQKRAKQ